MIGNVNNMAKETVSLFIFLMNRAHDLIFNFFNFFFLQFLLHNHFFYSSYKLGIIIMISIYQTLIICLRRDKIIIRQKKM